MRKTYIIHVNGQRYEVTVEEKKEGGESFQSGAAVVTSSGAGSAATVASGPEVTAAPASGARVSAPSPSPAGGNGNVITAPLPGKVVAVKVKVGSVVKKGQVLLVLEAMKMENEIVAAAEGTVKEVYVSEGASVNVGEPLVRIE